MFTKAVTSQVASLDNNSEKGYESTGTCVYLISKRLCSQKRCATTEANCFFWIKI